MTFSQNRCTLPRDMRYTGRPMAAPTTDPSTLARKLRAGERASLARAITLVESKRADHQQAAHRLVQELLPETGKAVRVGITGSPGVGKSTTIDALGTCLTGKGHKVAVLAVDPSSTRTGGSILGDKTRMGRLAVDPHAFIRPSPAASQISMVSRVLAATPPSVPDAGDGRTKALSSTASRPIRVLSPRIEPPVRVDEGSTASTATL